jgi:hypothetical protein
MRRLLRSLAGLAKLIWESLRDAIPLLIRLLRRLCALLHAWWRRHRLPERERRRSRDRCVPIHEPAFKRPDPLIYSQQYLMQLGLGVTWDNPDIELFHNGAPVASSALLPDTDYEVVARIWNGSTEAPVVNLPVRFSYLSFGMGTQANAIGDTTVDLGVIGGPNHPAFASKTWHTPSVAGHYCLQVFLDWLDDANPANNLGQENTNVGTSHSPVEFTFELRNPSHERLEYRFETDAYRLPPLVDCSEVDDSEKGERERRAVHDRSRHPVPDGWHVDIAPATPALAPGASVVVTTVVTPPSGFVGRQPINVHAFNRYGLAGGVTLTVEGV